MIILLIRLAGLLEQQFRIIPLEQTITAEAFRDGRSMTMMQPARAQLHPPHRPTIGVLTGDFVHVQTIHNFIDPLFRGIRSAAEDYDCNLLIAWGVEHRPDEFIIAWPQFASGTDFVPIGPWNTDGLLTLGSVSNPVVLADLQQLRATDFPLLFISTQQFRPGVVPDNAGGIRQALQHLKEHGHRRIAFIAGIASLLDEVVSDASERLQAYQEGLEQLGLVSDPKLIVCGHHGLVQGYQAMQALLASGVEFTAVVCSNDESASGAMRSLQQAGRRIPEDVAVVGFDNQLRSVSEAPPLTTIHYPRFETGYRAVEMMFQHIRNRSVPLETICMPTWLVVRNSCGCQQGQVLPLQPLTDQVNRAERGGPDAPSPVMAETGAGLMQTLISATRSEIEDSNSHEIRAICERLAQTLEGNSQTAGEELLQLVQSLRQAESAEDDPHAWQAAMLRLYDKLSQVRHQRQELIGPPSVRDLLLLQAQAAINESVWRQHNRHVIHQRWLADEVGLLTTRLLSVLNEQQILQELADYLPHLGISHVHAAHFESDPDDPIAHYKLSPVLGSTEVAGSLYPSRSFPPAGLYPANAAFHVALVPLVAQGKLFGFVAFDAVHLGACSIIAQQLATALNTAQMYQAATEARLLAEEASRLKSRFLSTISHELRTPLNLIVGLSDMLLREQTQGDIDLPEDYQADVERIHQSAQHLSWLIRDVLDLASSEVGQLQLACEPLDLQDGLAAVVAIGAQMAWDKGLDWQADIPPGLPRVWVDRMRLRQVVLNLISNAIKFTAQGEIALKAESHGAHVTISVRDTGLGVPPEDQRFIFDEFRQSERTTTLGYGGLGLGLNISKRLVELHGGQIGVTSSGREGEGATFYFTLPALVETPSAAAPPSIEIPTLTLGSQRVLILVEREADGEQLSLHLKQCGFESCLQCIEPTSDWLAQVLMTAPGAIVLEVKLAAKWGWEILKRLKEHPYTQPLPVLFFRLDTTHNIGAVLEIGYLVKPLNYAELELVLDHQGWTDESEAQKTILIVDDDPATIELNTRMVRSQSKAYRILKASDGQEALNIMRDDPPDLILLDLMMPGLDGFGVIEAMQQGEISRNIPVVVVTARLLSEADMARLNKGVVTVLVKGLFTIKEMLAHVEVALTRDFALGNVRQGVARRAMGFLHTHYAEALSREAVARYVGVSESYLTRCFRQETGLTLITYLNRYRINRAKALLVNRRQSVTDIAIKVGFSNISYFSRVFQREVGLWPSEYRRQARRELTPATKEKK